MPRPNFESPRWNRPRTAVAQWSEEVSVSGRERSFCLSLLAGLGFFLAVVTGILLRIDLGGTALLAALTAGTALVATGCLVECLQGGVAGHRAQVRVESFRRSN